MSIRRLARLATALAVFLAILLPATVHAQGTSGAVPEPMGLREATSLIGRHATLDGPTRIAIEEAHDRYLESFARFRDGDVQEFLELMQQVQGNRGGMPELALLDRFLDEWKDTVARAGRIDDAFFADVSARVGDAGFDAVERGRLVRARNRHLGSMSMMGGLGGVGTLDRLFWEMKPTPEEIAATDQAFRAYESAMPRFAEKIAESQVGMIRFIAASLVEQGFGDVTAEDMQDPERMQAMMGAVQAAMASASAGMLEARTDAEDRELLAARAVRDGLSLERWWRLKRGWMSAAVPMAGFGWTSGPENTVARHAEAILEEIDDPDARAAVEQIRDDWFRSDDRVTDEFIKVGREMAAGQLGGDFSMFNGGGDPFEEIRERRTSLATAAIDSMLAQVEDDGVRAEIAARIAREPRTIMQGGLEIPLENTASEPVEVAPWEQAASRSRMAQGVPTPMTPAEFEMMSRMIAFDDDEIAIARVMLDDHLEAWSQELDPIIDRAYAHRAYDENGMPDPAAMERQWDDLRRALEATRGLDDRFMGDLEATFGRDDRTDAFAAVRIQRAFDRMESIASSRFDSPFGVPVIEPVSPYEVLDGLNTDSDGAVEAMAAAIAAHESLRPAVDGWETRRFDDDRALSLEQVAVTSRQASLRSLPEDEQMAAMVAESQRMVRQWITQLNRRRTEAARRREVIESVVAERVVPSLSPLAALELRVAMLDAGRRGAVEDGAALSVARRVLGLRDLDEGQSATVQALLRDHLEAELELVEAISAAAISLADAADDETMEAAMQRRMQVDQEMQKFGFRRDEMRERLLQRLLSVLTPEQVARIPALQERAGG